MSTLIVLGGLPPSKQLAQELSMAADLVIAADKGYDHCQDCGIHPHVVTGDFDSMLARREEISAVVDPAPEQDATDFEKALRHVPADESKILVLGGTGHRIDHFLTNLLIAYGRPAEECIEIHDDEQVIHRVTGSCPLAIPAEPGTVISLIPFTAPTGVSTTGLKWNLSGESMGPQLLGQSNEVTHSKVTVEVATGTLLVVVNKPRPAS